MLISFSKTKNSTFNSKLLDGSFNYSLIYLLLFNNKLLEIEVNELIFYLKNKLPFKDKKFRVSLINVVKKIKIKLIIKSILLKKLTL